jgi:hypothetical protein
MLTTSAEMLAIAMSQQPSDSTRLKYRLWGPLPFPYGPWHKRIWVSAVVPLQRRIRRQNWWVGQQRRLISAILDRTARLSLDILILLVTLLHLGTLVSIVCLFLGLGQYWCRSSLWSLPSYNHSPRPCQECGSRLVILLKQRHWGVSQYVLYFWA